MGRFEDALRRPGLTAIAVKRRSPSAGDLRPDADPAALAAAYERAGAAAVSILVDARFGGTWDDLRAARAAAAVPLLAKGFFSTDETREPREAGADAALLLLRDLDDATARRLLAAAAALGLETLVEAHDAEELKRAVALDAPVVGINARDLATFRIDRSEQLRLVARAARDRLVIAESGIASRAQGAAAELAGADAILVGSTLMRAADPAAKLGELLSRPFVKVCGLTRSKRTWPRQPRPAPTWSGSFSPKGARVAPTASCGARHPADGRSGRGRGRDGRRGISSSATHPRKGRYGAAMRCSCATGWRSPASWISRGKRRIQTHLARARATPGRVMLAGGLGPENVRAAIELVRPWAVDAS